MAAVKGVNATKYDAGAQGDNAIDQGLVNADVEVWSDEYEASSLSAGSTIDIAELPAGAKVHNIEVFHDALGGSSTIDVGDSDDTDRYTTAPKATSAVGKFESDAVDGAGYVIGTNAGDSRIQLLTAGASITGTIKSKVYFTR